MDNSPSAGPPVDNLGKTWGPRRPLAWLCAAATIGVAVGGTLYGRTGDGTGALLFYLVAALLAVATGYLTLLNPRLTADASGVGIRSLAGTRHVPWTQLTTRVQVTRRLGRDAKTLELEFSDGGDEPELVVLGWLELGVHPDDALEDLNRLRAPR